MIASYVKALLQENGIHWNNNGTVGNRNDMGRGATVTYSFIDSRPAGLSRDHYKNFTAFSTAQQAQIRQALAHYEDVANINFVEQRSGGTLSLGYAETYFDFDGNGTFERAGGLATRPNASGARIVIDRSTSDFSSGDWGYQVWLHELGHAVGGFNDVTMGRNPDSQYAASSERRNRGMDGQLLSSSQDSHKYTLMSYIDHPDMPGVNPRSLGLYDIAAIQALYGANWSHNSGNNTYAWGANETFIETSWYGGGNDTISASNESRRAVIDLRAGHFSSIGSLNNSGDATDNLAIAYGATIENATGGSGSDIITGNSAANVLIGNAGNDLISGGRGKDDMDGGSGVDTVDYRHWNGGGTYNLYSEVASFAGYYNENIRNFENIYTGNGADRIIGTNAVNYISTSGGNDTINGYGGHDTILAGAGNDTVVGGSGNDIINGSSYATQGTGERDILTSGGMNDADTFVLGERGRVFYNDWGSLDYAVIKDFDVHDFFGDVADKIQLVGSATSYSMSNVNISGIAGTGLHFAGDLIGIVQNVTSTALNLSDSNQFTYV